jgi:hypothetical protein
MDSHIKIVAWLQIGYGFLILFIGLGIFAIVSGVGIISGERQAILATGIAGTVIACVFIVLSLPSIIAGFGLLKRRSWARILTIILSIFHLLSFPVGTAIGAYSLWALLSKESEPLFT